MAEIELKLSAPVDKLGALRAALVRLSGEQSPTTDSLAATYFDTRGHDLERSGLTLRVRREQDRFIQTVKSAGRTLTKRGEWSDTLRDAMPNLSAKNTGQRLRRVLHGRIKAQFKVDVQRSAFMIQAGANTQIEAAVDEGVIRTPGKSGRRDRVAEIELELKSGDRAALYTTALKLLVVAPLKIETRSKSARGYALVRNATPKAIKITPVDIDGKMTLDDVLRRAGLRYLTQCLQNTPAVLADSVEGIHQMRVALRRLRSLINAFKADLPPEQFKWANVRLRQLLQTLGPARNWDVFVKEMIAPLDKMFGHANAAAFNRAVGIARVQAHLQARDAVASVAHTTAMLELLRWFEMRGWRNDSAVKSKHLSKPIGKRASALLTRQFARARKRGRGFDRLPTAERHAFRIALKNLRYTIELLLPVLPTRTARAFVKSIKPLQDKLGHLNDLSTAESLVSEVTRQDASAAVAMRAGMIVGWYEQRAKNNDRKLCKQVAAFCATHPFW